MNPSLRALFAADCAVWSRLWNDRPARLLMNQCGLRATLLYRISQSLKSARVPFLPGWVARLNLTLHGLDIPPSVSIGPGLYVPHPVGTVVMAQRIGANCSLISGITIGMRGTHEFPVIGDDVFVGAGARILGAITLGNGVNIGANAVVLSDVPTGATAVGVPARILPVRTMEKGNS